MRHIYAPVPDPYAAAMPGFVCRPIGEGGGKHEFTGAGGRGGHVRRAWNRPLATGATGPPTHSLPSGPGRTSIVLGRPVNLP